MDFTDLLQKTGWTISLTPQQIGQLDRYRELLLEWNQKFNLTAITDPEEILTKHFLDSLSVLQAFPFEKNAAVLDLGSGAGFPGMVLKIARPDLRLTCLDGTQKKVNFLRTVAEALHLEKVVCLHARAEEAGRLSDLRETFDAVTARAVANFHQLAEYGLPFVKKGGRLIAMKGPGGEAEASDAAKAITLLGGEIGKVSTFTLPATDFSRTLVELRKIGSTPQTYPRPSAKIKKKPL